MLNPIMMHNPYVTWLKLFHVGSTHVFHIVYPSIMIVCIRIHNFILYDHVMECECHQLWTWSHCLLYKFVIIGHNDQSGKIFSDEFHIQMRYPGLRCPLVLARMSPIARSHVLAVAITWVPKYRILEFCALMRRNFWWSTCNALWRWSFHFRRELMLR